MQLKFGNPESVPSHHLFPAEYEATKRMIIRDFAFFGIAVIGIVATIGTLFG